MKSFFSCVILTFICTVATSCRTLGLAAFATPVVTLRDVRLGGINLTGGLLNVEIGIRNPNGYRLDARRLTYRLMIDTTELGNGGLDTAMTVQGGDSTLLKLPIKFTFAGLGAVARQLQSSGTLSYRVQGELTVATPVGRIVQPYDQHGTFALYSPEQTRGPSASRNH